MGTIKEEVEIGVAKEGCGNETKAKSRMDEEKQSKAKKRREREIDGWMELLYIFFGGGREKKCFLHGIPAERRHGGIYRLLGSLSSHEQHTPFHPSTQCTMYDGYTFA